MGSEPSVRAQHWALLARPMKHKITKKYSPTEVKFLYIRHPVTPDNNRRLDMLAEPNRFKKRQKWEEPDLPSTCVSRAVLEANCTARIDHLSKPTVRLLRALKRERKHYNKAYLDFLSERINMSLDTIYYHNYKSLMNIAAQKQKSKKSLRPKHKIFDEDGDKERMLVLATPKKPFPPRQTRKRQWKKLELLLPRINGMCIPRYTYKRPSQDSLLLRLQVSPEALAYQATERILELSKLPHWRLIKPWQPRGVSRAALKYEITDRVKQLATPAARSQAVDSDLKENAYEISPFALKYKATPRIIELAKPIER